MNSVDIAHDRAKNSRIIFIVFASVAVTLVFLFLLVLPARYGIDPTGFGKKLGINGLAQTIHKETDTGKAAVLQAQEVITSPAAIPATQTNTDVMEQTDTMPETRQDVFNLTVPAKQNLAFRFSMVRDYELEYHWVTEGKPIYCELHGQKQSAKDNELKVFGKLKESKAKGFFIAPFNGNFSLKWENKSGEAVTVRLTMKGVYKTLI